MTMIKELTKPETTRRAQLERTIKNAVGAGVAAGKALIEIRDKKLYRDTHKTFEAYCQDVWKWSRSYAYRMIGFAEIKEQIKMLPTGDKFKTERQIRPLLKVPREKLHEVVEAAAAAGAETHNQIAAVVKEVTAPELVDENGKPIPQELRADWMDACVVGNQIRQRGRAWKTLVDDELAKGDKHKQKHALTDQMSKDIGDMISEMSRTIPYAVCPWCEGQGKRCEKCHSRGWVSKIYWKQFVPAKFKKKAQEHNGAEIVSD